MNPPLKGTVIKSLQYLTSSVSPAPGQLSAPPWAPWWEPSAAPWPGSCPAACWGTGWAGSGRPTPPRPPPLRTRALWLWVVSCGPLACLALHSLSPGESLREWIRELCGAGPRKLRHLLLPLRLIMIPPVSCFEVRRGITGQSEVRATLWFNQTSSNFHHASVTDSFKRVEILNKVRSASCHNWSEPQWSCAARENIKECYL